MIWLNLAQSMEIDIFYAGSLDAEQLFTSVITILLDNS